MKNSLITDNVGQVNLFIYIRWTLYSYQTEPVVIYYKESIQ